MAGQLEGVGQISRNAFLLRLAVDSYELTVFPDGRAIIGGTDDIATRAYRVREIHRELSNAQPHSGRMARRTRSRSK